MGNWKLFDYWGLEFGYDQVAFPELPKSLILD